MTKDEKTARRCAAKIIDDYIPDGGVHTLSSQIKVQIYITSRAAYETVGAVKKFTSSYHPQTNGMVNRLNHTLCRCCRI